MMNLNVHHGRSKRIVPHSSRRSFVSLLLTLLAIAACSKKAETPVVARVGDLNITAEEFTRRFELNPRMLQYKDAHFAKIRFLGSLIAEKLLASEARHQGLRTSARTPVFLSQINREAVIEEFYNDKAASQVTIDEKEVREAYEKQRRVLQIQFKSFKNVQDAQAFRQRVLAGAAFDAPSEIPEAGTDTLTVAWGNAESYIEDALYQLKPGEVSEPIAAVDEVYVARLLSSTARSLGTEQDFLENREKIEGLLKKRKTTAAFKKYFREMMFGKETTVPPQRLKFISESLERAFGIGEGSSADLRADNPSPIDEIELQRAQRGLQANLHETLVTFDDGTTWTIREFLQRLSVGRYFLDFSGVKAFRLSLRQAVITMIEQEYVFKAAVAAGVHNSTNVQADVRMWREAAMAREYLQKLLLPEQSNQDLQEAASLSDEQLLRLDEELERLLKAYDVQIDLKVLNAVEVKNAGLLAFKTHFPGRLLVPVPLPLENLSAWQDRIRGKLDKASAEIAGHE